MNFKNMIKFVQQKSGGNFPAAIQIFGATFMALHFKTIMDEYGFVPVPLVIGASGTTKSTMAKLALASIGVKGNKFGKILLYYYKFEERFKLKLILHAAKGSRCCTWIIIIY